MNTDETLDVVDVVFDTTAVLAFISEISRAVPEEKEKLVRSIVGYGEVKKKQLMLQIEEEEKSSAMGSILALLDVLQGSKVPRELGLLMKGRSPRIHICSATKKELDDIVQIIAGPNEKKAFEDFMSSCIIMEGCTPDEWNGIVGGSDKKCGSSPHGKKMPVFTSNIKMARRLKTFLGLNYSIITDLIPSPSSSSSGEATTSSAVLPSISELASYDIFVHRPRSLTSL